MIIKHIWNFISFLGLNDKKKNLNSRSIILCNQINFMLLLICIITFIILKVNSYYTGKDLDIGSYRILILVVLTVINLILAYFKKTKLAKIILIAFSPVIFMLYPTFVGYVEEESFIYYPFFLIIFSVVPHVIFSLSRDKLLFWISLLYHFMLLISIDLLLMHFMSEPLIIVERIKSFYIFYKMSHIISFVFINYVVLYLKKINNEIETEIIVKNIQLDHQNDELIKALKDLKKTQQQLIQSEKMASLGTLIAGVAHEINNPLNYISGGLNVLLRNESQECIKAQSEKSSYFITAIQMINTGFEKVTEIVNSLMTYAYRGTSKKKKTDVNIIIESALLFLKSKITEDITIKKSYNLLQEIIVFPDKLHQVFINIIDNAIHSLQTDQNNKNKTITIKTSLKEMNSTSVASIIFKNNGPKIPENIANKVFDPFFTTKELGEGTGLGLYITYNQIKDHGGSIILNNNGKEVVFEIYLPVE